MSDYDGAWLDRMYNNRALVPEHPEFFRRWDERSRRAMQQGESHLDVAYGAGPKETLDVFPGVQRRGPVLVFIHGGYWRALDKSGHSFIAPAFTAAGATVVIPNYALCPDTTVPGIVMQMVRALAWTWSHIAQFGGDPSRITVAGHSAGGHLAAMTLACDWRKYDRKLPAALVRNALSISGLHDLEPIMHTPFLQASLRLTREEALRASPALLPAPDHGVLYAVAGGNESEEFSRQAMLMREAWGAARVPVCEALPGLNHFSILEAFTDPAHRLHGLALELLQA